jgi:ferric-dicitrate binding protein FerR (iron transport regulator)
MTQADVWLEGWLSGDLPASEMEAFQTWLRADARNRRLFLSAVALDQDLRAAWGIACWNPARKPVEGTDRSYAANGLEAC